MLLKNFSKESRPVMTHVQSRLHRSCFYLYGCKILPSHWFNIAVYLYLAPDNKTNEHHKLFCIVAYLLFPSQTFYVLLVISLLDATIYTSSLLKFD